jgi:soluble lytic murein transglycosylase
VFGLLGLTKRGKVYAVLLITAIMLIVIINSAEWLVKVFYPIYHRDVIIKYSREYDIDPYLISAIIRVESKFYHKAQSHKGARGLMQISQITGDWAASELGIENYDRDMLFEPEINIMIGCWYLHMLKKEFGNNLETVIAAYNGGSGNVTRWLMDSKHSSDGKTLTSIPFRETREYVNRVVKDYRIYKKLYS